MKKLLCAIQTIAIAFLLLSCMGKPENGCVTLPDKGIYCLQPTTTVPTFEASQYVEVTYKGRKENLLAEIESSSSGLHFVGLTPLGHKLLHINYNNREARAFTTPNKQLDPGLMVALVQLTLWPADAVRKGLKGNLTLEETHEYRRLLKGRKTVIAIRRFGSQLPYDRLQISIPSAELALDIKTLDTSFATKVKP
ncbi:MAG: DUF3261 domain-containing protein [Oxalobacter sp.]|nr:MAG: DUF3261 domain-containing protein [Oxalobacter sp.]